MDAKQMSGLDTLNQGLSKPDDKLDNCTVSVWYGCGDVTVINNYGVWYGDLFKISITYYTY